MIVTIMSWVFGGMAAIFMLSLILWVTERAEALPKVEEFSSPRTKFDDIVDSFEAWVKKDFAWVVWLDKKLAKYE